MWKILRWKNFLENEKFKKTKKLYKIPRKCEKFKNYNKNEKNS